MTFKCKNCELEDDFPDYNGCVRCGENIFIAVYGD